jgi:16S rRNA (cytosine967-C5)-methyltransferase
VFLDRIPVSAAVNTSVELAKSTAPGWVVRFVNAVLRRASVEHSQVAFPSLETDPVKAIAVQKSFPDWLVRRWIGRMGVEKTMELCDAVNRIPALTLRTNTLKTDRGGLLQALASEADSAWATEIAPEGIGLRQPKRSFARMEAFAKGWFQVQDEAAQLVTWMLHPQPGERVLDACAGLGGKTGHIAQRMHNRGELLAVDRSRSKLARLQEQMDRMGFTVIRCQELDLQQPDAAARIGRFDRILLDAPCSGLGVLRRNPDAKWRCRREQLKQYQSRQLQLLDCLANQLAAGGRLVYAVCSREPEEGQQVIDAFLQRHPEFELTDPAAWMPPAAVGMLQNRMLLTSPLQHDMDGFFAVSLTR